MSEILSTVLEKVFSSTYRLVNIPTAMLTSLLCFYDPLVNSEVPVHVSCLLPPSFLVCLESSPTLGTWGAQCLV